ncbi:hypothetical protein AALO_G00213260 [Alosa alosa]|uniref:Uncharacterized protein n=1 Tax=Alosa alosa TaxID=278164 RepID=A0AAV6G077_9TELE|nr:hypothetical protein AALO_G00213260 [Alosa alosa]
MRPKMTNILQGSEGTLQQQLVLRIHLVSLSIRDAKELVVKFIKPGFVLIWIIPLRTIKSLIWNLYCTIPPFH